MLPAALVSPETARLLDMLGEGTIDDKLRKLLENKSELKEINVRLRSELEDERLRISSLEKKLASHVSKIQDSQESAQDLHELQRTYTKEINEFKMRNQKLDHENIVIKQDVGGLVLLRSITDMFLCFRGSGSFRHEKKRNFFGTVVLNHGSLKSGES